MLSASSFFVVFGPTPHNADTGRSDINPGQESNVIWKMPPGLAYRAAIFAWSLFSPMPIDADSPVAANTAARTSRASRCGSATSPPKYASSQPHTSTGTSQERRVSITVAEAAS
jgi:hypothetical protein